MVMIPTAAASDAPCTFVSVLYSENGQEIVGDRIFHKCPDLVYVDTTIVAQAPVRLPVSYTHLSFPAIPTATARLAWI